MESNLIQVLYTVYKGTEKISEGSVPYILFNLVLAVYGIPNRNPEYSVEFTYNNNTVKVN